MNLNATVLGQAISFFLFVWFCMKYIWPPIITVIEKRQKDISDSLDYVKKERENLKFDQEKIKKEIKDQKEELLMLINQTKQQRNIILEEAKINAEKERKKIMLQAHSEILLEYVKIRKELRQQVGQLAIIIAEKIIQRSVKKSDNNDIINELITRL
ncbi:MAG TPA: F0F1 ATP synthase subunit B [Buchnera sp. (in: enterobacteria)]|nr:F0F1 ATP synthase subunit B [Buchnera sp. (in: enterobacteria)]